MSRVAVRPVRSRKDLKEFVHFPYRKYHGHPFWVPPPLMDRKALLNRDRHPFYLKAEAEFFLAEGPGGVRGCAAAIRNHAHEEYHGEKCGFFGFFETDDHPDTAAALLDAAANWCAARGLLRLQGPMNPSTNYECALLVDGFDRPPALMMPYNPPCYADHVEAAGFEKAHDLLAYQLEAADSPLDRIAHLADRLEKKESVRNRPIRLNRLNEELERVFAVYNDAWSRNWGFVPMSREELAAMAETLRWVCDPRIIFITEKAGVPVGFIFAMPDLNRIFKDLGGKLLPFGWLRLLVCRRKVGCMRVLAMGLRRDYQNLGYTALLYRDILRHGVAAGYPQGEIGWVLEDNVMMNRAAAMLGAKVSKRYRIFTKNL